VRLAQASPSTLCRQRRDNPAVPTVLIQLPGGVGVVRRDDGEIVITQDVGDGRGQPLFGRDDYRPVRMGLDAVRSIVAGLLPAGAVSVEVIDDRGVQVAAEVGGGVYAAILEQPDDHHQPAVCCRDGSGAPVPRPLPADWTRTEVTDAEEPCPACGAVAYDEVLPTDGSRGGRGGHGHDGPHQPNPITVCHVCGHEEGAGRSISRLRSIDDEPEDEKTAADRAARGRADQRIQKWYVDKLTLRGVAFPIYSAENWNLQIGDGFGTLAKLGGPAKSTGAEVSHLTIDHFTSDADRFTERARLKVMTSVDRAQFGDTPLDNARWVLAIWQHDSPMSWPQVSDAALKVWLAARDREQRAAVHTSTQTETLITIDGTREPFLTLTPPSGRWVAVRRHDDLTITIAGRDLDPTTLTLEPIPDPAARLLRPEPEQAPDQPA
jgi:hypothetical protein